MRLIDADALMSVIDMKFKEHYGNTVYQFIHDFFCFVLRQIRKAPTIDAVPVVRCRDCKHWKKGDFMGGDTPDSLEYGGGCPLVRFARYESDFCSKGERKEDDGNG